MADEKNNPVINVEDFFTRETGERGVNVPLYLPDGTQTDHWMTLISSDSEEFKVGAHEIHQRFLNEAGKEKSATEKVRLRDKKNALLQALLIKDWSFDMPCDTESKVRVLSNAPALAEMVDQFCSRRSNFFNKPSRDS